MYAGIGNYTPSTKIIFVFAVRFRILQGSRYSSQLNHSFALPNDSNFKTTMRFGLQSPSNVSTRSLTAMYFPPYFSTIGTTRFLYSSKPAESTISISIITYADTRTRKQFRSGGRRCDPWPRALEFFSDDASGANCSRFCAGYRAE